MLLFSTFVSPGPPGCTGPVICSGFAVDPNGDIFVAGSDANQGPLPTTPGAFQSMPNARYQSGYVAKISSIGTSTTDGGAGASGTAGAGGSASGGAGGTKSAVGVGGRGGSASGGAGGTKGAAGAGGRAGFAGGAGGSAAGGETGLGGAAGTGEFNPGPSGGSTKPGSGGCEIVPHGGSGWGLGLAFLIWGMTRGRRRIRRDVRPFLG